MYGIRIPDVMAKDLVIGESNVFLRFYFANLTATGITRHYVHVVSCM
jgi:hypothetical protein